MLIIVMFIGLSAAIVIALGRTEPVDGIPQGAEVATGVIVSVQSEGLTDVRSFTLRTGADNDVIFLLDRLENGDEFPPGHLVEHQAASSPVRVYFKTDGGINYALYLEDAEQTG